MFDKISTITKCKLANFKKLSTPALNRFKAGKAGKPGKILSDPQAIVSNRTFLMEEGNDKEIPGLQLELPATSNQFATLVDSDTFTITKSGAYSANLSYDFSLVAPSTAPSTAEINLKFQGSGEVPNGNLANEILSGSAFSQTNFSVSEGRVEAFNSFVVRQAPYSLTLNTTNIVPAPGGLPSSQISNVRLELFKIGAA